MDGKRTRRRSGGATLNTHVLACALVVLLSALLVARGHAEDTVIKTDGTTVRGTVINWTQASVSIRTGGMSLDLPANQVRQVIIPGAQGCEQETVAARNQLENRRYSSAVQTIVSTLHGSPQCEALGEVILQLMSLPPHTLSTGELVELGLVSSDIPAVALHMVEDGSGIPRQRRIEIASRALGKAEGEEFSRLRASLIGLYQAELGEAMAASSVPAVNAALIGIAELYDRGLQPIDSARRFTENRDLSQVERLSRAIDLIPLPADLRQAETSLMQLFSLAQSPMRSAQDQVFSRLEEYFFQQGQGIMARFRQSGDYPNYASQFELWKSLLPPHVAVADRMVALSDQMQQLGIRERGAFAEYMRLQRMAEAGAPAFVGEIDSQIVRFRESYTWTPARVEQLRQRKEQLAGAIAPSAAPQTPPPTPEETLSADFDALNPFAGSAVVEPTRSGS